jgi:hypothetical protein
MHRPHALAAPPFIELKELHRENGTRHRARIIAYFKRSGRRVSAAEEELAEHEVSVSVRHARGVVGALHVGTRGAIFWAVLGFELDGEGAQAGGGGLHTYGVTPEATDDSDGGVQTHPKHRSLLEDRVAPGLPQQVLGDGELAALGCELGEAPEGEDHHRIEPNLSTDAYGPLERSLAGLSRLSQCRVGRGSIRRGVSCQYRLGSGRTAPDTPEPPKRPHKTFD